MRSDARNRVLKSNIVPKEILRDVQKDTLHDLKDALMYSAGPYGSTTQIIARATDDGKQLSFTEYTKDGHTILNGIQFNMAIENSIQKELVELTRYITVKVGDGTTSAIVLSSIIFDQLCKLEKEHAFPPYKILNLFRKVAEKIKAQVLTHGRDLTLDDVYKIAMICTNNNEDTSAILRDIYATHGLDVFIDVGISNSEDHIIKTYDGLTLESGYSDAAYINTSANDAKGNFDPRNNKVGKCVIRNAHIYAFVHPIDTIEMTTLFTKILDQNIIQPYRESITNRTAPQYVPTVIMAPKISIDNSNIMTEIVSFMYSQTEEKPPLLIITNLNAEQEDIYSDVLRLCGCKPIKKYIDPEIQKKDIAEGSAATTETVCSFCGMADEVVADVDKTTFINPKDFYVTDEETGEKVLSPTYLSQIKFLETELAHLNGSDDINAIGNLKRRIHYLKANMADFLVGGVTITDRDSVRALVEDAVKNVRSSSQYGVGYGANFEGLRATSELITSGNLTEDEKIMANAILNAYKEMTITLYGTAFDEDKATAAVDASLEKGMPMNIVTGEYDGTVLCTIMEDVTIMDVISKIITVMFTTNQSLLQNCALNLYQ